MATQTQPWYTFPRVDAYGSPDPYGGFPKPDSNVQVPDGYPVTALLSGTVSGVNAPDGSTPAWGDVVTIKLDNPVNPIATHTAYLHLAGFAPGVAIGAHISAGQLIGYSGGGLAAGGQKVPLGFALYNGDYYGYGASWLQYLGSPYLNMTGLLNAAAHGTLQVPASKNPLIPLAAQNTATQAIPGLTGIFAWIGNLQGLWMWLSNPVRVFKLIGGIGILLVSILMLVTPGSTLKEKGLWIAKLVAGA